MDNTKLFEQVSLMANSVADELESFRKELSGMKGRVEQLPDWTKAQAQITGIKDALEKYTRQMGGAANGSEDRGDYKGMFPNGRMARDFGALCLSLISPSPDVRERAARIVADGGYRMRDDNGKFVSADAYVKDMGVSTGPGGGFTVPDQMVGTIISNVEQYGVARRHLTIVPMGRERQSWPKRTGGLTVYYPDEGKPPTKSDLTLGLVNLVAKKWAILTVLSREVDEDSLIALGEYIALEMGLAIAQAEDANTFIGDGTSNYGGITGVLGSPNTTLLTMDAGDVAFTAIAPKYLTRLATSVPTWAKTKAADPAYYMSPEIYGEIMNLQDNAGRPIYRTDQTEGFEYKINGYPVREVHAMPGLAQSAVSTQFVAFGSLRLWGMLGERRRFAVRRSTEVFFLEDQVALLAVPRQDIQETDGEAMAVLRTAAV